MCACVSPASSVVAGEPCELCVSVTFLNQNALNVVFLIVVETNPQQKHPK